VRIATWNLAGSWSDAHAELIDSLDADVLLLTEVSNNLELDDYSLHCTSASMTARHTWAAVGAREALTRLSEPHFATALARCQGWTFASSILPWRGGGTELYGEGRTVDKATRTIETLLAALPRERLIWGGDWNHALSGGEHAGTKGGRITLLAALDTLGLGVPTAELPHRIEGLLSIDHIAVPAGVEASATRVEAAGLSDHDAYVVEFSA
jgi:hypothetical protein